MNLLDRYIAKEFLRLFVLFALCAPLLFVLGDLTDHLDTYMDHGLGAQQVLMGYLYQMPMFILWSFPIAALIATVFTVNRLTRYSEVTAAKAGGVSFHRLVRPLPVLGIFLTFAGLGLAELVPITTRLRAEVMGEKKRDFGEARSDFVYRTEDGHVYSIRRLDVQSGRMERVAMEREGDEPRVPGVYAVANNATYARGRGWMLYGGYMRLFAGPGKESTFQFARMQPTQFSETPEQLLAQPKETDEMSYRELGHFIRILEHSGGKPFSLLVKQAQRIAIPVATFIIILFGAPLATSAQRGGAAYGIGISLGVTVLYMMLFKIAGAMGASGAIPPLAAAWLPNGIVLVAAVFLTARVET
jgi:lipopolysaccharide export system permease protein